MKKQMEMELTQREIDMIIKSLKASQYNYNSHINDPERNKWIIDYSFLEAKFGKYSVKWQMENNTTKEK